jgi:hypothetical protein
MAAKRPAKIASQKKDKGYLKLCPITNKPMVPVKVFRQEGVNGMHWVVVEEFDGSPKTLERMIPIR